MSRARRSPPQLRLLDGGPTVGQWELLCFEFPHDVAGEAGNPTVVTIVDATTGLALAHELAMKVDDDLLERTWKAAVQGAARHGLGEFEQLRVADPALAATIRALRPDMSVTIGPTPAADAMRNGMIEHFAPDDIEPTWFGGKDVGAKEVKALFAAGTAYRKLRPWQLLDSDTPIQLDIDALGIKACAASIISDDGTGGLSIFVDPHGMIQMLTDSLAPGELPREMIAVVFYRKAELPPQARDQLRRIPSTPKRGPHPMLLVTDAAARRQVPDEFHYVLATAALEACSRFLTELAKQADPLTVPKARGRIVAATTRGEVAVDLTLPHGLVDDLYDDAPFAGLLDLSSYDGAVHRLKISLKGSKPPIWRRVEVDSRISLRTLHEVIQVAMGWGNCHLHLFETPIGRVGPSQLDADLVDEDESTVPLCVVLPDEGDKIAYVYDFGDDWRHDILVEAVLESDDPLPAPRVVKGRRACPPEDCGGTWMFNALVAGDAPPHMLEPLDHDPAVRDPAALDLDAINRRLAAVFGE